MALYLETAGVFSLWQGEPIDDVRYPLSIEQLWTAEELAAINLYVPADTVVPAGKTVVSTSVQRVGGVVTVVYELADTPVTPDDVWLEKDRRLGLGFDYNFGDARGVHRIATTPTDMAGWDEVAKFAQALLNTGNTSTLITIMTGNGVVQLTALEWQGIMLAAAAFRQPIWGASFTLAAMNPIPTDYATNDAYWS